MTSAANAAVGRDEQAAEWCMRLAESELSAAEQSAFDAWLADARNRAVFHEAIAVWQGVENISDKPELIHLRTRALEGFRRNHSQRWARPLSLRWRMPAAAAAVLAIVAATLMFVRGGAQVYETGIGERRVVMLDDGSQLSLDAASRVQVKLADDRRELRLLAGRARFDVAKDALRPFSVAAADKLVVALGTSFSVELVQKRMHVILYEGRVEVLERPPEADKPRPLRSAPLERELLPGRELIAALDKPAASIAAADMSRSLSWESGQLNFVNEPLASAVERMNRYSRQQLVLADSRVAAFNINGVFTAGDTAAFVEGVKTFFPVEVRRQQDRLILASPAMTKKSVEAAVPSME